MESALFAKLWKECSCPGVDKAVAIRGGALFNQRWVASFEQVSLGEDAESTGRSLLGFTTENAVSAARHRSVFLVTGGLGRIGMVLAEHLGRNLSRGSRVVLTTRGSEASARPDVLAALATKFVPISN